MSQISMRFGDIFQMEPRMGTARKAANGVSIAGLGSDVVTFARKL